MRLKPVITVANQDKGKYHREPITTQRKKQARENSSDQVASGFNFETDWSRKWYEFYGLITDPSKASPDYFGSSFENCSKTNLASRVFPHLRQ